MCRHYVPEGIELDEGTALAGGVGSGDEVCSVTVSRRVVVNIKVIEQQSPFPLQLLTHRS